MDINGLNLSDEDLRIIANTSQFYEALLVAMREAQALPERMSWKTVSGADYLYEWRREAGQPKSRGRRSAETEALFSRFTSERVAADERIASISARMASSLAQYRALRLPQIMELPARILRELDLRGDLGVNLIVVGTNAFAAYEIEARERFARGLDETEDFDLGWCRGASIALQPAEVRTGRLVGSPLFSALKKVDSSFRLNKAKPYQAINHNGYGVELLTAPSVMKTLSPSEVFSTAAIPEQEWLLLGRPLRHVVCARDGTPAPLVVPDPRWMGLHKLWLAKKPTRRADKKDKDARQGELLLSAVARKMTPAYPMDVDFVLSLPAELLDEFNAWAARNKFVPGKTGARQWW